MHGGRLPSKKITSSEILKFSKNRDIERQFEKVSKIILKHRLNAWWKSFFLTLSGGKYKNPEIAKLSNGETFGITKGLALQYPQTTSEGGEPYGLNNAMNRTWRPSKKVVHLLHGLQNAKGIPADSEAIKWLIGEPGWLENAIVEAEKYRHSVIRNEFIKKYEENSIQVTYKKS